MTTITAAVAGASGYVGGEVLRLLLAHPEIEIGAHVEAWAEVMCTAAGLPPVPEGVATLPNRRGQRGRG